MRARAIPRQKLAGDGRRGDSNRSVHRPQSGTRNDQRVIDHFFSLAGGALHLVSRRSMSSSIECISRGEACLLSFPLFPSLSFSFSLFLCLSLVDARALRSPTRAHLRSTAKRGKGRTRMKSLMRTDSGMRGSVWDKQKAGRGRAGKDPRAHTALAWPQRSPS